jgi:hypothetical protein
MAPLMLQRAPFPSLLPPKETASAAQAVRKFLFKSFYNAPQAWEQISTPCVS